MATALEVAKYIVKSIPVDNLKLQKLLYYSQAVHVVLYGREPLFTDDIEAWDYGPVVPSVYHEYKQHGFDTIPFPKVEEETVLSPEQMRAVDMALGCFGVLSGPVLINQTHHEAPWKDAYRPGRPSGIISIDSIHDYFKDSLDFSDEE